MNKRTLRALAWASCLCLILSLGACSFTPAPAARPEAETGAEPSVPAAAAPAPTLAPLPEGAAESAEPVHLPISINEVMASNKGTLADAAGSFPDWVELYNYGSQSIDLGQLCLACGGSRWPLPAEELAPGAYLVVFCDGSGSDGRHASFTLPKEGAVLSLETTAGAPVERFEVPALGADESAWRDAEGLTVTGMPATPGFENSAAGYEAFQNSLGSAAPLQIHEVMVYNEWYLPQNGQYYDWVEIKNVSGETVPLSGWTLSDSGSDRARFALPERSLAPGEILLVYCTGDAAMNDGVYAPFGLSALNEQLFLSAPDGSLCDYVHLHAIPYQGSFGRQDGANGFFYFSRPTPGESNYGGVRSIASRPVLLGRDGVYDGVEGVTVNLTAEGEIHYTLDGSTPSAASPVYTEPLTLTATTVLRAISVREGQLDSDCLDLSYIINENHSLPVVSLVADPSVLFGGGGLYSNPQREQESAGSVALFDGADGFRIDCGIKLHGATSKLAQEKKSFKLCFRSRYDGPLTYDLFENGVTEFSSILLRAAQESTYSTLMRDNLMHQLAIRSFPELPAQDYKYAVLYINGRYWGVYNIREAHSAAHYAHHYGYDESTVTQWKETWAPDGPMADILKFAMSNSLANDDNYAKVAEHLNIDSIIGWCVIQAYCGNHDCNPPNMRYYYSTEDDRMSYALVDLDLGMFDYDIFDVPLNGSVVGGQRYSYSYNALARRLMSNRQFQLRMAELLSQALKGPMANDAVVALIDELANQLRPEIGRDRQRWAQGSSADSVEYWEDGFQMVNSLRDYVTRKGGRAKLLVDSFIAHANLSSAEIEEYFGDIR